MQKSFFQRYKGKKVNLRLKDGFNLTGTIDDVYEDCFEFTTSQGTSIIIFEEVSILMERNGGY